MPNAWDATWSQGSKLGSGGQGVTYMVTSTEDPNRRGVLKHLLNNKSAQARERMRREVVNLDILAKAGGAVPRVMDHNTDDYEDLSVQLYVVMEFIPGPTLRGWQKTGANKSRV